MTKGKNPLSFDVPYRMGALQTTNGNILTKKAKNLILPNPKSNSATRLFTL
jgi:hypothetical protein